MLFRGLIQWCKCGAFRKKKNPQESNIQNLADFPKSDPVGIQTQDLQNRNLTLYSAKLRDPFCYFACKITKKFRV